MRGRQAGNGTATNGTAPAGPLGDLRGPCNPQGGSEADISKDAAVVFSNIKTGDISTTY
jgi:Glycosyl hydrolase family 7